ncbi:hypothetical protein [Bacteroides sp.]|uniref:hypothetical protein n=1 Tax=Bacteroides sp. TaxID=29523 RepID=UPI00262B9036|nr:hypothetical protein [Bacteroides sp.]MDD3040573.1 hypothetical protein [Bacteroides sp.]
MGAIGFDYTNSPLEEFTNAKTTAFCPFIDNDKLCKLIRSKKGVDIIHRYYPTGLSEPNGIYHWVQLEDFTNVQCCLLTRELVKNFEMCEKYFTKCPKYKEQMECQTSTKKKRSKS